jgi:hypothetical protein
MANGPPTTVVVAPDDDIARFVGRTADGRQFFLTNPFVPAIREPGREFLALYLFDRDGTLLDARIDDLGTREELDEDDARARQDALLASLGKVRIGEIKIAPFRLERFGVEFGFIPQPPEEAGDDWSVIVEPGNYMCFWPPWTTGEYDT